MTRERDDLADDAVARAWREHMRETPPAAVDDAIRAAARRAVGAKPREKPLVAEAREPWRWWMPLAAAATIGAIAIGVIQNLPQDTGEPTMVSDAATARRAPPVPTSPAAPSASEPRSSTDSRTKVEPSHDAPPPRTGVDAASAPSPEQRDRVPLPLPRSELLRSQTPAPPASMRQDVAKPIARDARSKASSEARETVVAPPLDDRPTAAAPPPPVAALGKRADESAQPERKTEADASAGFVASPPPGESVAAARDLAEAPDLAGRSTLRSAPEGAAGSTAQATRARATRQPQAMAVTPPDVFIAEIRRLLAAGDRAGAAREVQRFRRTHVDADARLPDDLREFAASVARQ